MNAEVLTLLSDAQFVLAQILWEPRCDRDRALRIAELAARTHPDPRTRSLIASWLQLRAAPAVEEVAIDHLQRDLRALTDSAETKPVARVAPECGAIPTGVGARPPSYVEISVTPTKTDDYVDLSLMWPADVRGIEAMTQPFERV